MRILPPLLLFLAMQAALAQEPQPADPEIPGATSPGTAMNSLVQQHRWREASALAAQMTATNPQDAAAFYWRGYAELQLQNYIPSEQAFRSAEKLGMNSPPLHEGLGLAYYRLNQFILFEREMNLAAQLDPKDATPDYYLGLYQLTIRSDLPKALLFFDKASELKPNDWKILYEEGNCWEKQDQGEKAREYYLRSADAVEKNNQDFGWPFQGLARLTLQKNPREALEYAKKAVQREPREASNHLVLANAYSELGDTTEAIKEARTSASQNPSDTESRYLLFRLYHRVGDNQAAAQELKTFKMLQAAYGSQ
jgi:tetratricopeptide (TPR) repeat protein